eukprot:1194827-Prorocentrum_minimum.AAC.6
MCDATGGARVRLATKPNVQLGGGFPPTRDATGADATGGFPGVSYPSPANRVDSQRVILLLASLLTSGMLGARTSRGCGGAPTPCT